MESTQESADSSSQLVKCVVFNVESTQESADLSSQLSPEDLEKLGPVQQIPIIAQAAKLCKISPKTKTCTQLCNISPETKTSTQQLSNLSVKVPLFYGNQDYDRISPEQFLNKIETEMATGNWSDQVATHVFTMALRGEALAFLDTVSQDCNSWANLKAKFIKFYCIEQYDSCKVTKLSDLRHNPRESPRQLQIGVFKLFQTFQHSATELEKFVENKTGGIDIVDHLMKTVFIETLVPEYREKILSKKPTCFEDAANLAVEVFMSSSQQNDSPKNVFDAHNQEKVGDKQDVKNKGGHSISGLFRKKCLTVFRHNIAKEK